MTDKEFEQFLQAAEGRKINAHAALYNDISRAKLIVEKEAEIATEKKRARRTLYHSLLFAVIVVLFLGIVAIVWGAGTWFFLSAILLLVVVGWDIAHYRKQMREVDNRWRRDALAGWREEQRKLDESAASAIAVPLYQAITGHNDAVPIGIDAVRLRKAHDVLSEAPLADALAHEVLTHLAGSKQKLLAMLDAYSQLKEVRSATPLDFARVYANSPAELAEMSDDFQHQIESASTLVNLTLVACGRETI